MRTTLSESGRSCLARRCSVVLLGLVGEAVVQLDESERSDEEWSESTDSLPSELKPSPLLRWLLWPLVAPVAIGALLDSGSSSVRAVLWLISRRVCASSRSIIEMARRSAVGSQPPPGVPALSLESRRERRSDEGVEVALDGRSIEARKAGHVGGP